MNVVEMYIRVFAAKVRNYARYLNLKETRE
jgi:hypothetical protein